MTPADLTRALERLRGDDELLLYVAGNYRDLAPLLAALIEAAAGIHVKMDRDGQPVIIGMLPLSDALAALVAAINGDTP